MHYIITDDVEYAFPARDIDMVFKIIKYLKAKDIEYIHHFEE